MLQILSDTITVVGNSPLLSQNIEGSTVIPLDKTDEVYKIYTDNGLEYYTLNPELEYKPYIFQQNIKDSNSELNNAFIIGSSLGNYSYRYLPVKDKEHIKLIVHKNYKDKLKYYMDQEYSKWKMQKCNLDYFSWKYKPSSLIWRNKFGYSLHELHKFPIKLFNPIIRSFSILRNFFQGYAIRRVSLNYFEPEKVPVIKKYILITSENYYDFLLLVSLIGLNFKYVKVPQKSIPSWRFTFNDIETWNWTFGISDILPKPSVKISKIEKIDKSETSLQKVIVENLSEIYTPFYTVC